MIDGPLKELAIKCTDFFFEMFRLRSGPLIENTLYIKSYLAFFSISFSIISLWSERCELSEESMLSAGGVFGSLKNPEKTIGKL